MTQESYIESVLNTAALLFIPMIDDQLPSLLGFKSETIFKNFFTYESLEEFDQMCMLEDREITTAYLHQLNDAIGVEFSDFYLTNWPEQGSTSSEGIHFKPYQILKGKINGNKVMGDQISPTSYVTEKCLIRKIVWRYTTGFETSIKPRIGYLRLEMLNGEEVEINMMTVDQGVGVNEEVYHQLKGVFIITTFQMSSAILRLRICGSYSAENFVKAFDYYSLWSISSHARSLLSKYQNLHSANPLGDNYKSMKYNGSRDANFTYKHLFGIGEEP